MKKWIKTVSIFLLLVGTTHALESCSRDNGADQGVNSGNLNGFYGAEATGDGVRVKITRVQPSGNDFLEVFFDAIIIETPKRFHNREVEVSIQDNNGNIHTESTTIYGEKYINGNIVSARILMRVSNSSQLRKNTLRIVKVEAD